MKSIRATEKNPYEGPQFTEIKDEIYAPRTKTANMQRFYEKKYDFSERLLKLISLVKTSVTYTFYILTFSSRHNLLKTKLDRLYSIITKGSDIKTLNIVYDFLKIEVEKKVLPLGSVTLPLAKTSDLQEKTKKLAAKNISLVINNSTELPNPNRIKRKKIEKFLADAEASPKIENVYRKEGIQLNSSVIKKLDSWKQLFNAIDCISFSELKQGLSTCCQALNELLGQEKYSIGFAPNKSSKWMAEQALVYLDQMPARIFQHATDMTSDNPSKQSELDLDDRNFVIFDDAAYSGSQLTSMISGLVEKIEKRNDTSTSYHNIYIVIPFLSSVAQKNFDNYCNAFKSVNTGKLKLTLLTTDRSIKSFRDEPANVDLASKLGFQSTAPSLSITEWKIPDGTSMPHELKSAELETKEKIQRYDFFTNNPPPYKTKTPS
jgi:hypothetical protein